MLDYLWLIPVLPLLGFAVNGLVGLWKVSRTGRPQSKPFVYSVACGSVFLALLLSLGCFWGLLQLDPHDRIVEQDVFNWITGGAVRTVTGDLANLHVTWGMQLDPLSAVMILVVTGIGFLIHVYAIGYMADEEEGFYRFFAYMNLFMFMMLTLVLANSFLVLFVGWEGVGLCSYLLIGYYVQKKSAGDAAKKAFDDLLLTVEEPPSWDAVRESLRMQIKQVETWMVNSLPAGKDPVQTPIRLRNNIFVGGEMLGRGVTIPDLAVSYVTRRARTTNADTVEQRARWFGYKSKYLDVCRLFMTNQLKNDYSHLLEHCGFLKAGCHHTFILCLGVVADVRHSHTEEAHCLIRVLESKHMRQQETETAWPKPARVHRTRVEMLRGALSQRPISHAHPDCIGGRVNDKPWLAVGQRNLNSL